MTSHFRVSPPPNERAAAYEGFMGLDTSRSDTTQDTGSNQILCTLSGGTCDEYGQIVRDPGYIKATKAAGDAINDFISHVAFFNVGEFCWAYRTDAGIGFDSIRDHRIDPVWPSNARIASTYFNGTTVFVARALPAYTYNGYIWNAATHESRLANYNPSFITTVQNRAIIAGIPLKATELHFSATNQLRFYHDETDKTDNSVTRPGYIDIQNLISRSETITGIAPFEQTRLAVFTEERMILYNTDPDLNKWSIDSTANIHVGCLSHNTIQPAGTDLYFCSRTGVHSVQRSRENGILVFASAMSSRIKRLYKELVASVDDPQDISAVWDQDAGRYHIFFPQPGSPFSRRLTMTINPFDHRSTPKWSLTSFLNERCGDAFGGDIVFGTGAGIYREADEDDTTTADLLLAPLTFSTPWLWHGDVVGKKPTSRFLMQAKGRGLINVRAFNDQDQLIWSTSIQSEYNEDDGPPPNTPLSEQYDRAFETEYRGVRFEFEIVGGRGRFVFSGFAVYVKRG